MERGKKVKIGIVQTACAPDKQENLEKTIEMVKEVAGKGAQMGRAARQFAAQSRPRL